METPSNKSWVFAIAGIAAVAIILGIIFIGKKPAESPAVTTDPVVTEQPTTVSNESPKPASSGTQPTTTPKPSTPPTSTGQATYTMAQIGAHADRTSCWTAIRGSVYDLTPWISQHPGGQFSIMSLCGRDGTSSFENQHGGQSRPESELASFKIGIVAN